MTAHTSPTPGEASIPWRWTCAIKVVCLAVLGLLVPAGHRLITAAPTPAKAGLEIKETERVTVRHTGATKSATVLKSLRLQLQPGGTARYALVMTQKLPPDWKLLTGDFAPVVRVGTGDRQRVRGKVTGTGKDREAEVRLLRLPGNERETTMEVTYGTRLASVPKLPFDASVAMAPRKLKAGQANRVTVTLRLTECPATKKGELHAALWAPTKPSVGYEVVTSPKGFAAMDHCGAPGTTGGLWLDPAQALKWVLELTPKASGRIELGTARVTLVREKPLVPSPTVTVTPEVEVGHVSTYTLDWCETLSAGGGDGSH